MKSGANVQLCVVHLQRNVLKHIRPKDKSSVAADLKDVFRINDSYDNIEQAWNRWKAFCDKWGRYYTSIARMRNNERYKLYFTYLKYHYRIRGMIYTTNWIERLNRSYKRTTRMRGALPNPQATMLFPTSSLFRVKTKIFNALHFLLGTTNIFILC